jgi:HTH-type transcriptional regulator / antitoxin HigA
MLNMIRRIGKMTVTFNSGKYSELLSQYQPRLIRTEADNEQALKIVEELMQRPDRSPEEDELYDLLIVLIEKFEQEFYQPDSDSNPHSMLQFLIEQQGLSSRDLVPTLGSEPVVAEIWSAIANSPPPKLKHWVLSLKLIQVYLSDIEIF